MATTTLNTLLPEFAKRHGYWVGSFTTTTNITGSDKVIVSTGLISSGYDDDDMITQALAALARSHQAQTLVLAAVLLLRFTPVTPMTLLMR